jgi:transcriptional regulator with XRE-family HTH domain
MIHMKDTIKAAGLTIPEFAQLVGVSRNMVYKWCRGSKPHALREVRVGKILSAIIDATESGELPVGGTPYTRTAANLRSEQIQAIIINAIKKSTLTA